jgi:hypothetical protein
VGNAAALSDSGDQQGAEWTGFLAAVHQHFGSGPFMAARAAELVRHDPDVKTALPLELVEGNPETLSQRIGRGLRQAQRAALRQRFVRREGWTRTQHDAVKNPSG